MPGILLMVDLYEQLKPCRCCIIFNFAQPVLMRIVDSLHNNHAIYRVTPCELGNNGSAHSQSFMFWGIILRCIIFIKNYIKIYILYGLVCGIWGDFEVF